jgi:DNA (cytosine-5)-methyltransferase 1
MTLTDFSPGVRPVAIDLFSGAGGLSLGLEQAGFDLLAAVDYDPVHAAVHAFNFPSTETLCESAATLKTDDLLRAAERGFAAHRPTETWDGEVDLVAGGPPCQGFSTMGKRQFDDHRNDLVFHFWRLVTEVRPRYFVMENVPGMALGKQRQILDDLESQFRAAGYVLPQHQILDSSDFGVPQARRRLVIIGSREDVAAASHPTPRTLPVVRRGRTLARSEGDLKFGPTVIEAIGDLPDLDGFEQLLSSDSVRLTAARLRRAESAASNYARRMRGLDDDPGDLSQPRIWDERLLTSSMRTVHTAVSVARFAATTPGKQEDISRFLRLDPLGLCNTLRAGTGAERGAYTSPRPIHPIHPRVISVREAARLHSFPDWFRLHSTKWHGFRQIGNAVVPLLGRAIGESVVDALGARPVRPTEPLALGDEGLLKLSMAQAAKERGVEREALPGVRVRDRDHSAA